MELLFCIPNVNFQDQNNEALVVTLLPKSTLYTLWLKEIGHVTD